MPAAEATTYHTSRPRPRLSDIRLSPNYPPNRPSLSQSWKLKQQQERPSPLSSSPTPSECPIKTSPQRREKETTLVSVLFCIFLIIGGNLCRTSGGGLSFPQLRYGHVIPSPSHPSTTRIFHFAKGSRPYGSLTVLLFLSSSTTPHLAAEKRLGNPTKRRPYRDTFD
jgi:hypothetical protein